MPKGETYLNSYLEDFAVLSHLTDSLFYSTTMEASSAFSPIIRGSEKIMFLQNIDETMAKAAYELFQNNQSGFTFLYDDDNSKPAFLFRVLKSSPVNWNPWSFQLLFYISWLKQHSYDKVWHFKRFTTHILQILENSTLLFWLFYKWIERHTSFKYSCQ